MFKHQFRLYPVECSSSKIFFHWVSSLVTLFILASVSPVAQGIPNPSVRWLTDFLSSFVSFLRSYRPTFYLYKHQFSVSHIWFPLTKRNARFYSRHKSLKKNRILRKRREMSMPKRRTLQYFRRNSRGYRIEMLHDRKNYRSVFSG